MKTNMKMILTLILGIIVVGSIAPIVAGHTSNHGEVIVLDNGVQVEFKATGFVPWNDNAKNQMTSTITIYNVVYEVTYHSTGSGNKATSMVAIPNELTSADNETSINSWNYTDIEINEVVVNETNQTQMNDTIDTNETNQTIMNETMDNNTIVVNDNVETIMNDNNMDTPIVNDNVEPMTNTTNGTNNDIFLTSYVTGNPYILLVVAIIVILVGVAISRKH